LPPSTIHAISTAVPSAGRPPRSCAYLFHAKIQIRGRLGAAVDRLRRTTGKEPASAAPCPILWVIPETAGEKLNVVRLAIRKSRMTDTFFAERPIDR
jgi:hypothetical protein